MDILPRELYTYIFSFCDPYSRIAISKACKKFKSITGENIYRDYYLYSLEWLTPETGLAKRPVERKRNTTKQTLP